MDDGGDQVIRPVGIPSAEAFGAPTITFGEMVRATAEAIGGLKVLTTADVAAIVAAVVEELQRRREYRGWREWRENVVVVVAVAALIVAWLDYRQNAAEQAWPTPSPNITVVAPQPNITVVVPPAPTPGPDGDDPGPHRQDRRGADR